MKALDYSVKWLYRVDETMCLIYKAGHNPYPIAEGRSYTHYKDKFCKDTGRKLTLARALKNGHFTREQRIAFWEAYRKMKPNGRW